MSAAVAGLAVLTRMRAGGERTGVESRAVERSGEALPVKPREERRYVMGFETELMR